GFLAYFEPLLVFRQGLRVASTQLQCASQVADQVGRGRRVRVVGRDYLQRTFVQLHGVPYVTGSVTDNRRVVEDRDRRRTAVTAELRDNAYRLGLIVVGIRVAIVEVVAVPDTSQDVGFETGGG